MLPKRILRRCGSLLLNRKELMTEDVESRAQELINAFLYFNANKRASTSLAIAQAAYDVFGRRHMNKEAFEKICYLCGVALEFSGGTVR